MKKVLVIGSGGREHALAWALNRSPQVSEILCAPGNAGTATIAENIAIPVDDFDALIKLADERNIDLTVVGPEAPLCDGIVDRFTAAGLTIFGPVAAGARIEGDKAYAKRLMKIAGVPTAEGRAFDDYESAVAFVASRDYGVVIKASGLAAGKGVFVCPDPSDGLLALERVMEKRELGDAGRVVVVEEMLSGEELSVLAVVDGRTIYVLETAQDHKAVFDGDKGPNTGGMGAYSPAPIATESVMERVESEVLVPIVDTLRQEGVEYRGILYAGLMLTHGGPKVLEFNCRFGDPEAQAVIPRMESDLFDLLNAAARGRLEECEVRWKRDAAVCVVMASSGYPGKYEKGKVIEGLNAFTDCDDVIVFHAGTEPFEEHVITSGGRVLGVTGLGEDIAAAQRKAYEAIQGIQFDGAFYRRDIAHRALRSASNV